MTPEADLQPPPSSPSSESKPGVSPLQRSIGWLAQLLPAAAAAWILARLLRGARVRWQYPFDIEWMEGGMLVHAWRLREGLGLYVEPSPDFVPYIYPPLYAWVLSLLGEPDYATARILSLVATLLAAAAAAFAVRREGGSWGWGLGAAGLFLSCYEDSGTFYDLVRTDALALCLGVWSLVLCRHGGSRSVVVGGLMLFLAFTAKHNLAALGLPILIWLGRRRSWRRGGLFALASAGPALLWLGALQWSSEGWFLRYLLEVPSAHPLVGERGWPQAEGELWDAIPWVCSGALLASLAMLWRPRCWSFRVGAGGALALWVVGLLSYLERLPAADSLIFWSIPLALLAVTGLALRVYRGERGEGVDFWLGAAWVLVPLVALMRAHHGGFINVLMPGHWLVCVTAVMLMSQALRRWPRPALHALGAGLISSQIYLGAWEVEPQLPTEEDRQAAEQVIEELRSIEGEVLAPHFPWYPVLAGKQPSLPLIALWDIDHKGGPMKSYVKDFRKAVKDQHWEAALMPRKDMKYGLAKRYKKSKRIRLKGRAMRTRTGWRVQPAWVWTPQD